MDACQHGPWSFLTPQEILYGDGALERLADALPSLGTKALVVTDATMVGLGNVARACAVLDRAGIAWEIFDQVSGEPTDTMVRAGAQLFRCSGCDFMVGLGGGSPLDTMKAIALVVAGGGEISSYLGRTAEGPVCPMVAVPTTAGTGSEATRFAIITDTARDVKMLIAGPSLIPHTAVVDPVFTLTAPASVTAATGVDALCHAIESFTSRKANPLSETFSLSAARRIFGNLATCVREPENREARVQMSLAATEAGIAFSNASVTLIHGMSRPIGALFHVPHGLSNAMLMDVCLTFALDGAPERFARIARYCGISSSPSEREASAALMRAIRDLLTELEIPSLAAYGVPREAYFGAIEKMVADAIESGSPANTIRDVGPEDLRRLYADAYDRGAR
ncbi:iron-containing alcohol dehydrogenase [Collinsella vaginalis]|uniref:iron-containing alcohol dehydrogenase n=1 Tax=Collinsella vaginalis TaxID=1870987 RepID=UPI000A26765B|nr:iron-containing alcohol dehydrogenase [Collinsella vaginalis]